MMPNLGSAKPHIEQKMTENPMGVATGGGDVFSPVHNSGGYPQEFAICKGNFLNIKHFFRFFSISKIEWVKSEEKSGFGGRWF